MNRKKGRSRHELETAEVFSILEQLRDLGVFTWGLPEARYSFARIYGPFSGMPGNWDSKS